MHQKQKTALKYLIFQTRTPMTIQGTLDLREQLVMLSTGTLRSNEVSTYANIFPVLQISILEIYSGPGGRSIEKRSLSRL